MSLHVCRSPSVARIALHGHGVVGRIARQSNRGTQAHRHALHNCPHALPSPLCYPQLSTEIMGPMNRRTVSAMSDESGDGGALDARLHHWAHTEPSNDEGARCRWLPYGSLRLTWEATAWESSSGGRRSRCRRPRCRHPRRRRHRHHRLCCRCPCRCHLCRPALAARPRCRRLPSPLACRCRSSSYLYDYGTRYICEHLRWSPAPVLSHLALVRVAREFV